MQEPKVGSATETNSAAVVVSGLGVIGPFGCGRENLVRALEAGKPRVVEVPRPEGYHRRGGARMAAKSDAAEIDRYLSPRAARRMSWLSRYGVAAAAMALEDAGLGDCKSLGDDTAVITSTSFGSPTVTEELLRAIIEQGPEAASPMLFPESVANAPAAQIGIVFGARGPNLTLTQRVAGPLLALAKGVREIERGRARRALVGVVDEVHSIQHAVLDRFCALAINRGEGEVARPFDRDRGGFLLADGSCMLVLERADDVAARGGSMLIRVVAAANAFDPSAKAESWGEGVQALSSGLRRCLEKARRSLSGRGPEGIGRIVSGASGAIAGDALEARVLKDAWGESPLPQVFAPKGVVGEYGGGFLAAAILMAAGQGRSATAGFQHPCPRLGLTPYLAGDLVAGGPTLVSTLAPGGAGAWLCLDQA